MPSGTLPMAPGMPASASRRKVDMLGTWLRNERNRPRIPALLATVWRFLVSPGAYWALAAAREDAALP